MRARLLPGLLTAIVIGAFSANALAKGTGYLFVSSEKDNNIMVLDGSTYAVVKTIATAERPRHLQFNPERTRIYAACGDGDAIDIIDVQRLELVDRISGIDDPELFDFSPDGRTLFISLEDDARLGILDLDAYFAARGPVGELETAAPSADDARNEDDDDDEKEGEQAGGDDDVADVAGLTTIEVGEEPEGVMAGPDGNTVYVTSEVANMVHIVDLASGEIRDNVLAGNRPRRFAMPPGGNELWVTNELSGTVSVIDVTAGEVIDTIEFNPDGFRPEDVTPVGVTMTADGSTAVVSLGRANHVVFVDVASREVQDYVLVGNRAWNITLNRDESRLYVANGLSDDISIIDMSARKVLRSIPVGRVPHTVLIDD